MYCRLWHENNIIMYRYSIQSLDILLLILPYSHRIFITRVFYAHILSVLKLLCQPDMCHIWLACRYVVKMRHLFSFLNQCQSARGYVRMRSYSLYNSNFTGQNSLQYMGSICPCNICDCAIFNSA